MLNLDLISKCDETSLYRYLLSEGCKENKNFKFSKSDCGTITTFDIYGVCFVLFDQFGNNHIFAYSE